MKTIVLVAIAIICAVGILTAVFFLGSRYQQELFEEYVEESQSPRKSSQISPNLPTFEVP
ncbi:MAG: hypothetical protein ACE5RG_00990 [Candidatus Nitrosomaritimum yanchengensis]